MFPHVNMVLSCFYGGIMGEQQQRGCPMKLAVVSHLAHSGEWNLAQHAGIMIKSHRSITQQGLLYERNTGKEGKRTCIVFKKANTIFTVFECTLGILRGHREWGGVREWNKLSRVLNRSIPCCTLPLQLSLVKVITSINLVRPARLLLQSSHLCSVFALSVLVSIARCVGSGGFCLKQLQVQACASSIQNVRGSILKKTNPNQQT